MIGKLFGHYQIVREIGFGGMSAVYLAEDTRSTQPVALKLLPAEYINDLGLRASFEREAQLIAALEHEAILRVFEFGEQDGQPFIAMQYMPNGSLADRLIRAPISPERTTQLLERLSCAIDYAHERGIIHRDLKPSNVLFDERDQPYLADFGIAWQSAPARRPGFLVSGTPAYLSPEQAFGEQVIDSRSDIYALGIILFEMLTGKPPFDGQTPLAIILQHRYDPPPSLRTIDWSLPANLDQVIQHALAKSPDERYSTARQLSDAFHAALQTPAGAGMTAELSGQESLDERDRLPLVGLPGSVKVPPSAEQPGQTPHPPVSGLPSSARSVPARDAPRVMKAAVRWQRLHFLSLGLATILGVLLAGGLVAFLRALPAKQIPSVAMDYDSSSFTITNQYSVPVNLSKAAFERLSSDGSVTANFLGSSWQVLAGSDLQMLQPGACFQVLSSNPVTSRLAPGGTLPKPEGCRILQGWLVALEPGWLFWVSEGDSLTFRVTLDGSPVKTCHIAAHQCDFKIPEP